MSAFGSSNRKLNDRELLFVAIDEIYDSIHNDPTISDKAKDISWRMYFTHLKLVTADMKALLLSKDVSKVIETSNE